MAVNVTNAPVRRTRAGAAVWAARILLALVFLYVGLIKLPAGGGMWVRLFDRIGFGQWLRYVTAIVEMLGGVLMLVPRATPVAVVLIAGTMIGALITHATVIGFGSQTIFVSAFLALALFIGWSHRHR
jgi:uncharacterized membrane protein YphA (DoxX/SURF4 family)